MSLRILYVAYPLLAISDASCGGAEQVLLTLEREMWRRGHHTVVAACEGSQVSGELFATGNPAISPDAFELRELGHSEAILWLLVKERFDLVHDMSGSFWRCAAQAEVPVLATLHLPPELYIPGMFDSLALNLYFNCVSRSQARAFCHLPRMLGVVENGIDLSRFHPPFAKDGRKGGPPLLARDYLLWMGRICEEKAPHIAIDVAAEARLPLVMAGQVYPFSYHRQYFEREVEPRLKKYAQARFVPTPAFEEKVSLLKQARALLITSQIDETSSLVAMEAMACGTPVIAFRRGALPEVIEHDVTGFIAESSGEMVDAVKKVGDIEPDACRARVERFYTSSRMADDYEDLYNQIVGRKAFKRVA